MRVQRYLYSEVLVEILMAAGSTHPELHLALKQSLVELKCMLRLWLLAKSHRLDLLVNSTEV
jgi:hypothetical protein